MFSKSKLVLYELFFIFFYLFFFTATPVAIIIPGIQETTALLLEIIHTENTPIPVPEMTMAQCQEDTGMRVC